MYQHLIDRADRRLRAVRLAKCIVVGGPLLALILVACAHRDDGLDDVWRGVKHMEDRR